MDAGLVRRIDAAAGHYGRSKFLAEAAQEWLNQATGVTAEEVDVARLSLAAEDLAATCATLDAQVGALARSTRTPDADTANVDEDERPTRRWWRIR